MKKLTNSEIDVMLFDDVVRAIPKYLGQLEIPSEKEFIADFKKTPYSGYVNQGYLTALYKGCVQNMESENVSRAAILTSLKNRLKDLL